MGPQLQHNTKLQQAFSDHIRSLCYERLKVLYYLGVILVPLFGFLDLIFVSPHLFSLFLALRFSTALILLSILIFAYPSVGKHYPSLLGIVGPLIVGGSISIMTRLLGGYESSYYAGLNLVMLGVSLILPFGVKETSITCGLIYGTYLIPIVLADTIDRPAILVNNNFFLLGTITIAIISSYFSQRLRFREFHSRYLLALTNQKLTLLDQEKTSLFSNLSNLINTSLDLQGVILSVLKLIKENFGFDRAACLRFDREALASGKTIVEAEDESFKEKLQGISISLRDSSGFSTCLREGKPILISINSAEGREQIGRLLLDVLETKSLAALPLKERGETRSVLLVDYAYSGREIPQDKFQLLVNLSQPISAALEKARLFESEKKRTSQLLAIHNIGRTISSILDFAEVFKEFARLLQSHFNYEHVSIYRLDDENRLVLGALVDGRSDCSAPDAFLITDKRNVCRALNLGKTILSDVPDRETRVQGALHAMTKSQLCIPFHYFSRILGVINIESGKYFSFDQQDITVLEILSDYLAIWLNNANLYNDIGHKANALQTLNRIGRAISSELNINSLFALIHGQVERVLPSENFFIALYEEGSKAIEVKFEITDGKRGTSIGALSHDALVAYVMQSRKPFLIKDNFEKTYEAITGHATHSIAQSWLGVPLILGEESLGVIVLQNFRIRHAYDNDDLVFLSTIADQAAVAISNAHLFREAQERATRLAVVNEITREVSLKLEIDKLFEKINAQLKRVVSFEKSSISIYEPETDTFSLINVYAEHIKAGFYKGMEILGHETIMKTAYDTKKPYYVRRLSQIHSNNSSYLLAQGIQSAICLPIISDDLCIGTLNLGSRKEDGFSDDEIDLLVTIANSLGAALKNARLYSVLEQSYLDLQHTQEQLVKSEKLRALGEMSAGVAHEFNNILAAILGRAQLMKGLVDDPEILRGLSMIEKAARDGACTVKRLQDFTRKRTDQVFKQVDLIQVIEDTLSMTRPRWEDSAYVNGTRYSITTQYEPVLPVAGESSELREVFTNIIFNALDAMPAGGKINIHVGTRDDRVFASITDTGPGMTEEVRRKVFDPFFTTKGAKGNGLGMSVAYGIITRHKGEIEVESELGKGTNIKVTLPINLDVPCQEIETPAPSQTKTGRFLVIDDEASIRDLLAELLSRQGHVVFTASGGKEGLEIFKNQAPDLVITDLGMPEVSGWEVASTVKQINPITPVILMTGWGVTLDKGDVAKKGIDMVISKPFQIAEIQKILNGMIEWRCNPVR